MASTASFTWPLSPACGRAGDRSSRSTFATTSWPRSGCSWPRRHRAFAWCTHPRPRSTATPNATRRARTSRHVSPYGITKLGWEHLARSFSGEIGLDAVGLRYFTVFGPRQRPDMAFTKLARAAGCGESFDLLGDGNQSRDFTYVSDAVAATILAMTRGRAGVNYNVGGGAETTVNRVISLIERLPGRTIAVRRHGRAAGDVRRMASDTTRIRHDLGWHPRTPVVDGLAHQLAWIRSTVDRVPAVAAV